MKILAVLTLAALLAGCTSYPQAINYRPKNSAEAPYVITGKFNSLTNNLIVSIDGDPVINETLSFVDGSGEFFSKYDGHKVHVSCKPIYSQTECTVFIDGERAGAF